MWGVCGITFLFIFDGMTALLVGWYLTNTSMLDIIKRHQFIFFIGQGKHFSLMD
jgi:hypothetical protein